MLARMTLHKSTWDVKFLSIVYINWGMFSVFMYHGLTYCYINNEHEKSNFYFSVLKNHCFTEFNDNS